MISDHVESGVLLCVVILEMGCSHVPRELLKSDSGSKLELELLKNNGMSNLEHIRTVKDFHPGGMLRGIRICMWLVTFLAPVVYTNIPLI